MAALSHVCVIVALVGCSFMVALADESETPEGRNGEQMTRTADEEAGSIGTYLTVGSTWVNELQSLMRITEVDHENGNFAGMYQSIVGNAERWYGFQGRFDKDGWSLGWVVSWNNQFRKAYSTTTWSGQMQVDSKVCQPVILTSWLLTVQTDPVNNWNSTNIGFDTFCQKQLLDNKACKEADCSDL